MESVPNGLWHITSNILFLCTFSNIMHLQSASMSICDAGNPTEDRKARYVLKIVESVFAVTTPLWR